MGANFHVKLACKGQGCYNRNSPDRKTTEQSTLDLIEFLSSNRAGKVSPGVTPHRPPHPTGDADQFSRPAPTRTRAMSIAPNSASETASPNR